MGETTCSLRSCSVRWLVAGAVVAALLVAVTAPARADKKKALEYYEKGSVAYNVGQFNKSITWFTKAYEEHQAASFLFNIAQSHRQMGHCKKALFFYGRYLTLDPKAENRDVVEDHVAELEGKCGSSIPDKAKPTRPVVRPVKTKPAPPPPVEHTAPAPAVVDDSPVIPTEPTATASGSAPDEQPSPSGVLHATAPGKSESAIPIAGFAELGPSFISVGDLDIPTQVSFHFGGDYHVTDQNDVAIRAGLGITITPLPWDDRGTSGTAYLYSILVHASLTRELAPRLRGRAQVGVGFAFLTGITDVVEQPFTERGFVADGAISMAAMRFALGAEYELAHNFVATVSPIVFAVTSEPEGMTGSFRRFEMLGGVTYQF